MRHPTTAKLVIAMISTSRVGNAWDDLLSVDCCAFESIHEVSSSSTVSLCKYCRLKPLEKYGIEDE